MSLEKPTVEDFGAFSYDEPIFESWEPNEEDLKTVSEPEEPVSEPETYEQKSQKPVHESQSENQYYDPKSNDKEKQHIKEPVVEKIPDILKKIGSFIVNSLYIVIQIATDLAHVAIFNTLLGNNERLNITKSINTALIKAQGLKEEPLESQKQGNEELHHTKEQQFSKEEAEKSSKEETEHVVETGDVSVHYHENSKYVTLMDEQKNSFTLSKEEVFTGNVEAVAKKLHEMCDAKNKMECMIQASLIIAKVRIMEGEKENLSLFTLKTDRGLIETELKMNQKGELAVLCNGKYVLTEKPDKVEVQDVQECIHSFKERDVKLSLGEITVSVGREFTDVYIALEEGIQRIGCYKFETEQDVTKMIEELKENAVAVQSLNEMHITPEAISYVTGIITNPEMEFQRNEDGNVLNPFTGEAEHDGNAHLFYHQDTGTLMMYEPNEYEKGVQTEIFRVPSVLEMTEKQYNGMIEAVQTCQLCMKSNVFEVADHHREDEQGIYSEQVFEENHFFEENIEEAPQLSNEQIYELFEEECR